ncbi:MAG: nucleotidyltransferase domain-containing protein [Cyclobacteriaceae bacterium]|nr:nucleotidyltransferase domain-containing protein [Cyclobacteriaceae bacterium]
MNTGLSKEVTAKLAGVLELFPEVESAILYGSRAKGNFKPGSDIDLSLTGQVDHATLLKINHLIDELSLPYFCDVTLFHFITNQELIEHILRKGILLYKKSAVTLPSP